MGAKTFIEGHSLSAIPYFFGAVNLMLHPCQRQLPLKCQLLTSLTLGHSLALVLYKSHFFLSGFVH